MESKETVFSLKMLNDMKFVEALVNMKQAEQERDSYNLTLAKSCVQIKLIIAVAKMNMGSTKLSSYSEVETK